MGTKTVRLDEEIYERIKARKREDETFSEAIERLVVDVSLLDLADRGEYDVEREAEMKAALDRTAAVDSESIKEIHEDDDS